MSCRLHLGSILFAGLLVLPTPAHADHKTRDYHGGALDARGHGYEHGYREGFDRGLNDHNRRAKYDVKSHDYKDADNGYEKYMGDKGQYKSGYQNGYRGGYDDAFYSRASRFGEVYGPFPSSRGDADRYDDVYVQRGYAARDVAYDIGYRDGLESGGVDMRDQRPFRAEDHGDFRDGSHGYRGAYGDREAYRSQYRTGYLRGYQDAFGRR